MNNNTSSRFDGQAAVLIALHEDRVLLTRRSAHLSTHAGEVALPGGMWETVDNNLVDTALRESFEEVGLTSDAVNVESVLPYRFTRTGTKVTPVVAHVVGDYNLVARDGEVDAMFWFPLSFIRDDIREYTDVFTVNGAEHWAPVYRFQEFQIWGFTSRVLVDFANKVLGVQIRRQHDVPEKHRPV